MAHQGYGFCEFLTEEDAEYACKIMNQIKLWGKPIRVNKVCPRLTNCYYTARSNTIGITTLLFYCMTAPY
jgi:RNA recognition motif-containing protein